MRSASDCCAVPLAEIFTAAPAALQLFPFKDELDIYSSPALKTHALGVMKTVGTAVSMLDDLPALVPVLKDLGAKHVKYGVKDAHCESERLCALAVPYHVFFPQTWSFFLWD